MLLPYDSVTTERQINKKILENGAVKSYIKFYSRQSTDMKHETSTVFINTVCVERLKWLSKFFTSLVFLGAILKCYVLNRKQLLGEKLLKQPFQHQFNFFT